MNLISRPRRILNDIPSLFSSFFDDDWFNADSQWLSRVPATNIKEQDGSFNIEMAVPGMSKKDFHIDIENGILTVSSEREEENKEEKKHYRRQEYNYRSFSRSFTLPESVKADDIKAKYEDGVLKLSIPKKEEAKTTPKKMISIQ
ncbi:HSP20 family protein [Catalinimonas alkaloidigena]|uniref:Hsp20/alpha crystallin family protein n=1 Tax=Catalinimonas alkaloidigena TaxID=1075417 RepID=UPI002405BE49|nr:Hsp20/alpha crystallin family protein [Catalinimonas alkaloidigena]MDF9797855.1 HSP20 family protein [Catalinimonas alkaloidigena]